MKINKVTIENYLCYFGIKEFELSDGLNIFLGENGEGKTKFFEAIDWLLKGDRKDSGGDDSKLSIMSAIVFINGRLDLLASLNVSGNSFLLSWYLSSSNSCSRKLLNISSFLAIIRPLNFNQVSQV